MMKLEDFHNLHKGQTCLIVGNAPNLHLTPPESFDLPAIGMNTIFRYENWTPNYYVAVDQRIWREFGTEINRKYRDIPKFVPTPHLDDWQGENVYRFRHLAHELTDERQPWTVAGLRDGFAYRSSMHAALQIAAFLGFTTLLLIGVEHNPADGRVHFWGTDERMPLGLPLKDWLTGYKALVKVMRQNGIRVLNLSEDTYVPDEIIPKADWRAWAKAERSVYESQNA